jgi:hypothetical protein
MPAAPSAALHRELGVQRRGRSATHPHIEGRLVERRGLRRRTAQLLFYRGER